MVQQVRQRAGATEEGGERYFKHDGSRNEVALGTSQQEQRQQRAASIALHLPRYAGMDWWCCGRGGQSSGRWCSHHLTFSMPLLFLTLMHPLA